jgi:hypothetical protein
MMSEEPQNEQELTAWEHVSRSAVYDTLDLWPKGNEPLRRSTGD